MNSEWQGWKFYLSSIAGLVAIIWTSFCYTRSVPYPSKALKDNNNQFSEARAWQWLEELVAFGPKLAGSPSNEVLAPVFLIHTLTQLGAMNQQDPAAWQHDQGLATRHWLPHLSETESAREPQWFKDNRDVSETSQSPLFSLPKNKSYPVCPCEKKNLRALVDDVHRRLRRALWLCAPFDNNISDRGPPWLRRVAQILNINSAVGCISAQQWIAADLVLLYFEDAFGLRLAQFPLSQYLKQLNADQKLLLINIGAETIASELFFQSLGAAEKHCSDQNQRFNVRYDAGCAVNTFPIERYMMTRINPQSKEEELLLVDLSLSHNYTGRFTLNIANGGVLVNLYQNLTVVAAKFLPFQLAFTPDANVKKIIQTYRMWTKEIKQWYTTQERSSPFMIPANMSVNTLPEFISEVLDSKYFDAQHPTTVLASHFDTAVSSPGAADAGAGVAVILEVTHNLLSEANPAGLKRPWLVLLNGGEEGVLPAAHGFVTQHPWAAPASDVINLEAAGSWGKEFLLRTGSRSREHLKLYRSLVQSPLAIVGAQDAFEKGLIPGLTDFEIFRDLGEMEGFDFALGTGGYYYHTPWDSLKTLQKGSLQHYGNTVLSLAKGFLNRKIVREADDSSRHDSEALKKQVAAPYITGAMVREARRNEAEQPDGFFDIVGHFFTIIPSQILHKMTSIIALLSVCAAFNLKYYIFVVKNIFKDKFSGGPMNNASAFEQNASVWVLIPPGFHGFFVYCGIAVIGTVANAAFALGFVHRFGFAMRWFTEPHLAVLLYFMIPLFGTLECLNIAYGRFMQRKEAHSLLNSLRRQGVLSFENELFLGVCFVWTGCFILGVITRSRIGVIPLLLLLGATIGRCCGSLLKCITRDESNFYQALGATFGNFLALLAVTPYYTALVDHIIPVFGRTVINVSPEVVLAMSSCLFLFVAAPLTFVAPLGWMLDNRKNKTIRTLRKLQWLVVLPLGVAFVLSFPVFTAQIPRRLDAVHYTSRRYDTAGNLAREEHGLTLQTSDCLEVSPALITTFAEALAPLQKASKAQPPSSLTSFFELTATVPNNRTTTSWFPVEAHPKQFFYRFPQGNVFRRFASRKMFVIPDLPPPFVKSNEEVNENSKKGNVNSLLWAIEDEPFLNAGEKTSHSYTQRHRKLESNWTIEKHDTRSRIRITVNGSQRMLLMIPATQPLLSWSLTPKLPPPRIECACFAALFSAGSASPKGFSFEVEYNNAKARELTDKPVFTFIVSANYFDVTTSTLAKVLEVEQRLAPKTPLMTATSVGEVGYWEIEP